jgi:predicted 2-oxoglutarate/Fe(II)-dependent dioxygenase YbiX
VEIIAKPNLLTALECQELMALSEKLGYSEAKIYTASGPVAKKNRRNNSRLEYRSPDLARILWERLGRIKPRFNKESGYVPYRLSETFKFYRYQPGQYFDWHRDGSLARGMTEKSFYTLLVYLNRGYEGGTTDITDLSGEVQIVEPGVGLAVAFEHQLLHRGAELKKGTKYLLRTDVLFKRKGLYGE